MTKIKNTKKGMAKKTLSMSLVVAMLATSNVPVWAAEFSDGSDVAVETEAPAAETFSDDAAETPIVDNTEDATPASIKVNEADITVDLTADKTSVTWGTGAVNITGTVNKNDGSALADGWNYRWVDENGVVANNGSVNLSGKVTTVAGMSLTTTKLTAALAGKKLTLYVYDSDSATQRAYDINTGITVSVEKQELADITVSDDLARTYNGFAQSVDLSKEQGKIVVTAKDNSNSSISTTTTGNKTTSNVGKYYTLTSTSGTNAGDKLTVTASADTLPDSPYKGSVSCTIAIKPKTYANGDIIANVASGLKYQYTGYDINIPKDKITVTESKSKDNGADQKLNGADLSGYFKKATVDGTVGNHSVNVTIDGSKLNNIVADPTANPVTKLDSDLTLPATEETVEITKRDLSTAGTKISVATTSGQIPTTANVATLGTDYLSFTAAEGGALNLKQNKDYTLSVTDVNGDAVTGTLHDGSTYKITIKARKADNTGGGTCEKEQTISVVATSAVFKSASYVNADSYAPSYTGSEVKPTKEDLGNLKLTYITTKTENGQEVETTKEAIVDTSSYEITGYSNNINASKYYDNSVKLKKEAVVNIKITSGTYENKTCAVTFGITPLKVDKTYVTMASEVSYNKGYKTGAEYKPSVTVVAKDAKTGKKVEKTLSADDYTVKYDIVDQGGHDATNAIGNYVRATVTVTNRNYIYREMNSGSLVINNVVSPDTYKKWTKIVAKRLTDAMVVVNPSSYTYTGGKIEPSYSVVDGAIVLYKQGEVPSGKEEYREVSITDAVNVGTGKITVEGVPHAQNGSGYSGTATGSFTITPANTSSVKVEIVKQKYTGKQIRPRDFKATLNGNDVTDQFEIVSYGENVNGTGTVVLKPVDGNKNFTGSNITANFNIVKEIVSADLKVYNSKGFDITSSVETKMNETDGTVTSVNTEINPAPFTFDGNAHTFAKALLSNIAKVNDDGVKTTAKVSDFEIKYADNITGKKFADDKMNVAYVYAVAKDGTGFAGSKTLVTSDGTVIKDVVAYMAFSIDSVEFVKQNVSIKNATYAAGLPVKPEVLIQIGGSTLVEGKDYKLELISSATTDANNKTTVTTVTPVDTTVGKIYGIKVTGINGYEGSTVISGFTTTNGAFARFTDLAWGVDKKNLKDCKVTVKDGVVSVVNGYIPVASTEYTSKNNGDGTYTVTAVSTSKNYTGSVTVKADGKAEDEKPNAPMISSVKVVGNQATAILSGDSEGAAGYDYVISTDRDCIKNKDYASVNKNQVSTSTTFKYVQQGTYYAYCHAWKRDANGKKVFSDWSNAYPFVVSAITPDAPVITNVKVSGSTIKVTYKAAANATGYDVVLGTGSKKENGETRPYQYGNHKKLNLKEGTVTATFKNVPKGTWVVGMHAFNRTSEDGKKVFSPWSNLKKATVK
nr:hypothetical protein [uncultured Blautia sp.]